MPRGLSQYCFRKPDPTPRPQTFKEWVQGLKFHLAQENIPYSELPDGTIRAKFGTVLKEMPVALQEENYFHYLDKLSQG